MKEALKETLFLSPVTETEINKIIRALTDSATGHDEISSQFLKLALNSIVNPLTHICNMPLTEDVFRNTLKVANVIPLYKSDNPMSFNHYRPVSLLCILSKVFEKIMYDRLLNFVDKFDLLYAHQYGFRKNRSTYMALLSLVDNLKWGACSWCVLGFLKGFWHWIIWYCYRSFIIMGFEAVLMTGSQATCLTDHSSSHVMVSNLILIMSNVVYHKALYWVHLSSFYISMT